MSILKLFSGKTPEEHEQKGDELFAVDLWGKAKVEYERALDKLEKLTPRNYEFKTRLQEKILQAKEALALGHKQNADDLMESGFYDDARELYVLAHELSENSTLKNDLEMRLKELDFQLDKTLEAELKSLRRTWDKIQRRVASMKAPAAVHREAALTSGIIRDLFGSQP